MQTIGQTALGWSFFDACRETHPDLHYDPSNAIAARGRELTKGELGCYSSHYSIWKNLLESESEGCIVLEDDVIADWDFLGQLVEEMKSTPSISYLRLYYKRPCPFVVRKTRFVTRSTRVIELFDNAYGTQGYYIDRRAAAAFVDTCKVVRRPIDDQMDRFWEHGVPNLSLFPFPLIERAAESAIGNARFASEGAAVRPHWPTRTRKHLAIIKRRLSRLD